MSKAILCCEVNACIMNSVVCVAAREREGRGWVEGGFLSWIDLTDVPESAMTHLKGILDYNNSATTVTHSM